MRGLVHFWRSHLAVTLGAAVACAVLTGALIVGDSVRGSLRDLVLDRLGSVDQAVVSESFIRASLTEDLGDQEPSLTIEPAISMRGSVTSQDGLDSPKRLATDVQIFGVSDGFAELFPEDQPFDFTSRLSAAGAVVNESLARELDLEPGAVVFMTVERPAEVPRETLVGREEAEETIARLRLSVAAVVPDSGVGGFRFSPQQAAPLNLFVPMERLQRTLFGREHGGRVNTFLIDQPADGADTPPVQIHTLLAESVRLGDLGLTLEQAGHGVRLGSRQFVLGNATAATVTEFASENGLDTRPSLTYLANSLDSAQGSLPYSTVTALDTGKGMSGAFEPLVLTSGKPVPALADDEILIDAWAAEDLGTEIGQPIEVTYFELGARDELAEKTVTLRLAGVTEMTGPASDRGLTPEFPGMADADDMAAWNPPFPVNLDAIRPRDEEYWDLYEAAPKAFVSLATGQRLWTSRFGNTTSLEIAPRPEDRGIDLRYLVERQLPRTLLEARSEGLTVLELRSDGLDAAKGATDFGGLFIALSFFLIGSAALLVALLFRLGVEQRAREVGLLRAVGFPEKKVRRRFLVEGLALAALGSAVGVAGAAGYAGAMLSALRTWWREAVGTTGLELHLEPLSLAIGFLASILTVAFTLWLALRNLRRVPAPSLLAGVVEAPEKKRSRLSSKTLAWLATAAAVLLVATSPFMSTQTLPLVAMGIGSLLLVAGIAFFSHSLGRDRGRVASKLAGGAGRSPVLAMGARNSARNAGRSLASVALIASAVFLLVVVGANRRSAVVDVDSRDSGTGGFRLLAESDVPLTVDLNDPARHGELGITGEDSITLASTPVLPLRRLPGEDASCLNLYRPGRPNVLGVPAEMIERGGFAFQSVAKDQGEAKTPWQLLQGEIEPGVIPAIGDYNSAVWILHLGLGKDLVLEDQNGEELRLRLVGMLKKSIFQSEILISEENFLKHFPRQTGYSFFLIESPSGDDGAQAEMTELLEGSLDRFGFDVTSTAERIAAFQAVENTYIATFQTLGGLGLLLGTIGLGVVLLRNVLERRGELATLRAFGFRKGLLARMVLAENGVLLVVGIAIGAVAGVVGVLPNLLSEGHLLPGASLGITILLVFVVGMLASVFAVVGTVRAPLLPALKGD